VIDSIDRHIGGGGGHHSRKARFWRIPKGTFQRRAATPPSGPRLGSWLTPTTGALPKATPRTAGGRLLRGSVEMLREPHGLSHWDPI
jgi:hypothetical protein